jgi:hypothetical protein
VGLLNYDSVDTDNIIKIIEPRCMRWGEHVARMGEKRNACRVSVRKPEGEKHLEGIDSDRRMILKCIL